MSVVVDTNLVVSRYISPIGNPAHILSLWEHDASSHQATEGRVDGARQGSTGLRCRPSRNRWPSSQRGHALESEWE